VRSARCAKVTLWLLLIASFAGCAGNGQGLDDQGNPAGTGTSQMTVAFAPSYRNIQKYVLDSACLDCHVGASASLGLTLDETRSYKALVGRRSSQSPQYLLVDPGKPDTSYLIRKLEGAQEVVGAQMPLNRPRLPQSIINSIRLWIQQGGLQN